MQRCRLPALFLVAFTGRILRTIDIAASIASYCLDASTCRGVDRLHAQLVQKVRPTHHRKPRVCSTAAQPLRDKPHCMLVIDLMWNEGPRTFIRHAANRLRFALIGQPQKRTLTQPTQVLHLGVTTPQAAEGMLTHAWRPPLLDTACRTAMETTQLGRFTFLIAISMRE
jgi:hypothetical protein